MEVLAARISRELENYGHCAVYEEELSRIWPMPDENRQKKIENFAQQHQLKLGFYRPGLCAIFTKAVDS
jgi:hypothetical protein